MCKNTKTHVRPSYTLVVDDDDDDVLFIFLCMHVFISNNFQIVLCVSYVIKLITTIVCNDKAKYHHHHSHSHCWFWVKLQKKLDTDFKTLKQHWF
jgi:hypothetical protein